MYSQFMMHGQKNIKIAYSNFNGVTRAAPSDTRLVVLYANRQPLVRSAEEQLGRTALCHRREARTEPDVQTAVTGVVSSGNGN